MPFFAQSFRPEIQALITAINCNQEQARFGILMLIPHSAC